MFLVLALVGCPTVVDGCTEIGCADGFTVQLQPELSTPGAIEVEVALDGEVVTCATTLPLDGDAPGGCEDDRVSLWLSGSALPADQHRVTGLSVATTPTTIAITIRRDGEVVAQGEYTPAYETLQPNGEDCPPTCTYASDSLDVDSP